MRYLFAVLLFGILFAMRWHFDAKTLVMVPLGILLIMESVIQVRAKR